jgi:hypothetical protein
VTTAELPGPNPTTPIYSASVVNFYNATGSLACFENENILFPFEKRPSLLQRWRCSCKFKSRRIGSTENQEKTDFPMKNDAQNQLPFPMFASF